MLNCKTVLRTTQEPHQRPQNPAAVERSTIYVEQPCRKASSNTRFSYWCKVCFVSSHFTFPLLYFSPAVTCTLSCALSLASNGHSHPVWGQTSHSSTVGVSGLSLVSWATLLTPPEHTSQCLTCILVPGYDPHAEGQKSCCQVVQFQTSWWGHDMDPQDRLGNDLAKCWTSQELAP